MNKLQAEQDKRLELLDKAYNEFGIESADLYDQANKLYIEADKLEASENWDKGDKYRIIANKILHVANKLYVKFTKLQDEANSLWYSAIVKAYGNNIKYCMKPHMRNSTTNCHLENGEVYIGRKWKDN